MRNADIEVSDVWVTIIDERLTMKKHALIPLAVLPTIALALGGCSTVDKQSSPQPTEQEINTTIEVGGENDSRFENEDAIAGASKVKAATLLKKLKVSGESRKSYSRSKFKHWTQKKGTGCNTRVAVLKAESKRKVKIRSCKVYGGKWVSAYDGKKFTNPSKLDIDHMVPLKEAWESGAYKWTSSTRQAYANDTGYKNSLVAVSASSNRSKSDKDPTKWMPKKSKCAYTANWISVKYRWGLTVDKAEKKKLTKLVKSCKNLKADNVSKAKVHKTKTKAPSKKKKAVSKSKKDPRFSTCTIAKSRGYGPYKKGKDPEYNWYIDRDKDGWACE